MSHPSCDVCGTATYPGFPCTSGTCETIRILRNRVENLETANEQLEARLADVDPQELRARIQMLEGWNECVTCPGCAFRFGAEHIDGEGGYTCPIEDCGRKFEASDG